MGTTCRLRMPRDFRWCERLMPSPPKRAPDQANCARRTRPAMTKARSDAEEPDHNYGGGADSLGQQGGG
jgi:hypothetical protein